MGEELRSDAELLEAANRDERAFGALVRRYIRSGTLLAVQLVGDSDEADDVVQLSFSIVYEHAPDFDASRPFAPWFFGIVRRLAHKRRIGAARRARLLSMWGRPASPASHGSNEDRMLSQIDVDAQAVHLRTALRSLPAMQRACFELVTLRHLAPQEVATMHGIAESTVRQHVFRARKVLRRLLPADVNAEAAGSDAEHDEDI